MEAIKKGDLQSNLLKLADLHLVPVIFNVLDVNYTIIDANGNYISQNNSTKDHISHGLLKAQDIDEVTWNDCKLVMQSREKAIKEEFFRGRYYLSIKQPLIENDVCIGIMVISIDITERKQAELAKAEFLRNMSHDIRTPFVGILGIARLLQSEEIDPDKQFYLNDLVGSSERLLALLNQILEVSYTDIDGHPLEQSAFNIRDVVNEVSELMAAALKLKGLTLNFNCQDKILNTDKFRLTRMLLNMVGNAIKFTKKGQINVEVVTEPKLKIIVEDTGIGIPDDKLKFIFNKFTKLKQSGESQTFTGSGIGLYMAKQFANELGGDIFVESELGKGSKFTFTEL